MARKILLVYAVYTIIVFLINTYFFKEDYTDALLKAVLSGVVFTAIYAIITMRNEKRQEEEKEKGDIKKTSPRKK
jgi:galactitol-specific phosphotransferase system IIC component